MNRVAWIVIWAVFAALAVSGRAGAHAGGAPETDRAELITAERAAEDDLVVVLPRKIDMGMVPIGDRRERRFWVINPSETEDLRIKALRFDCGCTRAEEFQVMTLEPGEARAVELTIDAPMEVGKRRDVRAFFVLENGDAVFSTIHFETVDNCSGFSIDPPAPEGDVLALPGEMDLGDLDLGVYTEFTAWVVNTSDEPKQIERLKASCPCLSAPEFESSVIEPGRALRIDLQLRPETEPLDERRVRMVALDGDGLMCEMAIRYSVGQKDGSGAGDGWESVPVETAP